MEENQYSYQKDFWFMVYKSVADGGVIDLVGTNLERTGDIRCLCPKCLHDYISNPNYVVRRLDPFAPAKDKCDKCNKVGWDYIIFDRRNTFGEKEGQ